MPQILFSCSSGAATWCRPAGSHFPDSPQPQPPQPSQRSRLPCPSVDPLSPGAALSSCRRGIKPPGTSFTTACAAAHSKTTASLCPATPLQLPGRLPFKLRCSAPGSAAAPVACLAAAAAAAASSSCWLPAWQAGRRGVAAGDRRRRWLGITRCSQNPSPGPSSTSTPSTSIPSTSSGFVNTSTISTSTSASAGGEMAGDAATEAVAAAAAGGIVAATTAPTAAAEIARRIAASRARRATRLSYNCPACCISAATPVNIARHMSRCCADLMRPDEAAWAQLESLPRGYPSGQHDLAVELLRAAGGREQELRRRVLMCVFWSGPRDPETGLPQRLEADQAASRLGLPPGRAASLLQRAMASVPLASDPGGPLDVVFEDEHFLAVNKAVGLHTAPIHRFTGGSVVNRVIAYLNRGRGGRPGSSAQVTLLTRHGTDLPHGFLPELMPVPEPFTMTSSSSSSPSRSSGASSSDDGDADAGPPALPYQLEPYVLHRLDMNTSGLLLFAKRPEVVAGMHRQFRERTLSKLYLAAAVGCPAASHSRFEVDAPIDRHPAHAVARIVADSGKEASTSFAVLASNPRMDLGPAAGGAAGMLFHERSSSSSSGRHAASAVAAPPSASGAAGAPAAIPRGASLVVCAPHSGRTHQIRVHLHLVGHPIVGDDIYGITGPWLDRQALHAASLHFTHPLTGRPVQLSAPLHDDMAAGLRALGLPQPDVGALAEEWRELARVEPKGRCGRQRSSNCSSSNGDS